MLLHIVRIVLLLTFLPSRRFGVTINSQNACSSNGFSKLSILLQADLCDLFRVYPLQCRHCLSEISKFPNFLPKRARCIP